MNRYITAVLSLFLLINSSLESSICLLGNHKDYIAINGGLNFLDIDEEDGLKLEAKVGNFTSLSLGYQPSLSHWIVTRVEAEIAYRYNKIKRIRAGSKISHIGLLDEGLKTCGSAITTSLLFNGYFDIPIPFCLQPYVGVGLGYNNSRIKLRTTLSAGTAAGTAMLFFILSGYGMQKISAYDLLRLRLPPQSAARISLITSD